MRPKRMVTSLVMFNVVVVALATLIILLFLDSPAPAAAEVAEEGLSRQWGFISAALAVGIGSLGAAVAVAAIGSSAMGAMSEKPELGGRALIFLGLAEGIAIYGLIIAIMILGKF